MPDHKDTQDLEQGTPRRSADQKQGQRPAHVNSPVSQTTTSESKDRHTLQRQPGFYRLLRPTNNRQLSTIVQRNLTPQDQSQQSAEQTWYLQCLTSGMKWLGDACCSATKTAGNILEWTGNFKEGLLEFGYSNADHILQILEIQKDLDKLHETINATTNSENEMEAAKFLELTIATILLNDDIKSGKYKLNPADQEIINNLSTHYLTLSKVNQKEFESWIHENLKLGSGVVAGVLTYLSEESNQEDLGNFVKNMLLPPIAGMASYYAYKKTGKIITQGVVPTANAISGARLWANWLKDSLTHYKSVLEQNTDQKAIDIKGTSQKNPDLKTASPKATESKEIDIEIGDVKHNNTTKKSAEITAEQGRDLLNPKKTEDLTDLSVDKENGILDRVAPASPRKLDPSKVYHARQEFSGYKIHPTADKVLKVIANLPENLATNLHNRSQQPEEAKEKSINIKLKTT
ncbi:hypothetical protein [Aquimarina sp. MMG016]|uniref:hypothetical protein n=1 Tax=Aquimarina sp. MMG016 TaxID=2822690 RepID=UPI001B3A419D|nr:hypothetical protein [Aquimarina sp. MMG016]MBQ4820597.1 hypothetical protein [Aquimarina sp. MMG016]